MTDLALSVIAKNIEIFDQLKVAQLRLEKARFNYELGNITRREYITMTEECIKVIRNRSNSRSY